MAKYLKNRNYVPPSKGKTVLVQPSKDKNGVVKQDWNVYIGHGLNNKHWVLEKSKWSNPFYMPKLSAKICNERYRRHILSSKHLQGSLKELVAFSQVGKRPQVVDLPLPRVAEMTRYHNPTRPAHLKGGALVRRRRSYSPNEFRSVQGVGLEQTPAYFTRKMKSVNRAKSAPHRRHFGTREKSREKFPSPYCYRVQRVPPSRRDSRSSSRDRSRSKSPSVYTAPIWIRRMRCMPVEHSQVCVGHSALYNQPSGIL